MTVPEAIDFLNGMREYQLALAAKHANQPARAKGAEERAQRLKDVMELLQPAPPRPSQLSLTPDDLRDLPDELLEQLSISKSDYLDFDIVDLINSAGGITTIDHLIIALYRKSGEIHERTKLNSRLYRMTKKGMIKSLEGKKGVYATRDITDADLFEVDQGEETSP
ncbi:TPA: hypothetical protein L4G76_000048 [Pseudomonas aeruginosa]|uniref:hypothetical protein n=1 Tax=Pseudomonas aeruginosa TaxID=287 RepID=UPI0018C67FEA|nr:hypothetical protein [Pseudomonas aeruginosa]MBG5782548.1 hypothetical protein [Pseudomonas aeruginosa]MDP5600331.1 hypothetical protein [Pseudomonas aeruginosa]WBM67832.1 hypothetical protein N9J97_11755 [Pseudomonas aeruginosa]HBO2085475.1 hypothetical protein [Pseudomonas aeruginosa]HBO2091503.1 hypothetical protein [Pseudomonas aeruginosa]